jgi:hypothetical protein
LSEGAHNKISDQAIDDTTDVPAVPPVPEERAFEQLTALTALVVDPEAVKNRLSELRKEVRQIARARIELSQEASRHAEAVRRDRAEIEASRAELAERERAVAQGEASVAARLEVLWKPPSPYARLEMLPGGGARAPEEPPSRAGGRQSTAADDETELERVGPSSGTLTRSVPRPRKTMRRGADG